MRWFGPDWGAPVNKDCSEVEAPLDRTCLHCTKPIEEGQRGLLLPFAGGPDDPSDVPYHIDCFAESVGIAPITKFVDNCFHPLDRIVKRVVGRRSYRRCMLCGEDLDGGPQL